MKKRIISLFMVIVLLMPCVLSYRISAQETTTSDTETSYKTLIKEIHNAIVNHAEVVEPSVRIQKSDFDFTDLFYDLLTDYPELFYFKNFESYNTRSDGSISKIKLNYIWDKNSISSLQEKFEEAINNYVVSVNPKWSDMQKIIYVYDRLVMESEYDDNTTGKTPVSSSAYGILVEHKGFCDSYSLAFLILMRALNIECKRVVSYQASHVWNLVKCNGSWYHVDPTFGDPSNAVMCNHSFLLLTDSELRLSKEHGTDWEDQGTGPALDRTAWKDIVNPIYEVNGSFYTCIPTSKANNYKGKVVKFNDDFTKTETVYEASNLYSAVGRCHTHLVADSKNIYKFTDENTSAVSSNLVKTLTFAEKDHIFNLGIDSSGNAFATSFNDANTPIIIDEIAKLADKHDFIYSETASTCTEKGIKKSFCTKCKYSLEEELPFAHEEQIIQGKPATHTETGLTDGIICKKCKAVIQEQTVIPKTEHQLEDVSVIKKATCLSAGQKQCRCTLCDYTCTVEIPQLAHSVKILDAVPATCVKTGLTEGMQCTVCNTIIEKQTVIPATGIHTSSWETTKKATCTATGKKVQVCSVCNMILKTETIAKIAHKPGSWTVTKKATCKTTGKKYQLCKVCKTIIDSATISKTAHKLASWTTTKKATCTSIGKKVQKCKVCKKTINTKLIAKVAHIVKYVKPKTSNSVGYYQCTKCKKKYTIKQVMNNLKK